MRDIAAEQRAMTIRMLLEGRADPAGAKRLGVSPRTYAGYVADLKNEFEVETRFQLGYEMGKRGISGRETDESRLTAGPARPSPTGGKVGMARAATRGAAALMPRRACGGGRRTRTRGGLRGPCPGSSLRADHGTTAWIQGALIRVPRCVDRAGGGRSSRRRIRDQGLPRGRRRRCGVLGSCVSTSWSRVTGDDLSILAHRCAPRPPVGCRSVHCRFLQMQARSDRSAPSAGRGPITGGGGGI